MAPSAANPPRPDLRLACLSGRGASLLPSGLFEVLRALKRHYQTRAFPFFFVPSSPDDADENFPDCAFLHYQPQPEADLAAQATRWLEAYGPEIVVATDAFSLKASLAAAPRPAAILYYPAGGEETAPSGVLRCPKNPAGLAELFPRLPSPPPAREKPQLIYCDPTLYDEKGHYWKYARNVFSGLRAAGASVTAVTNRMLSVPLAEADLILPLFWVDAWCNTTSLPGHPGHPQAIELCQAHLELALQAAQAGPGDHVFLPPLQDKLFVGMATKVRELAARFPVTWHFLLWDPLTVESLGRLGAIKALRLSIPQERLRFYADTAEFCRSHEQLTRTPFALLPVPIEPSAADFKISPIRDGRLRVSFLGNARDEKGFLLLPSLVAACRDLVEAGLLEFHIQLYQLNFHPIMVEAARQLRELGRQGLAVLVEGTLDANEYARMVDEADVLLCLYNPNQYKERSSMIFFEGTCSEKAVLIARGCAVANLLPSGCPWVCGTLGEAVEALRTLCRDHEEGGRRWARQVGPAFRAEHNGRRFAEILLSPRP
ncbi:MAG: hypothetical protein PW734_06640 [Verrucomicrobium sp.]|nr:hypothetical protein [Verrucomicrobium sp.]